MHTHLLARGRLAPACSHGRRCLPRHRSLPRATSSALPLSWKKRAMLQGLNADTRGHPGSSQNAKSLSRQVSDSQPQASALMEKSIARLGPTGHRNDRNKTTVHMFALSPRTNWTRYTVLKGDGPIQAKCSKNSQFTGVETMTARTSQQGRRGP